MAVFTRTVTTNGSFYMCDVHKPRNGSGTYYFTGAARGAFGAGTVAFGVSFDNGANVIPLTPINGNATFSLDTAHPYQMGNSKNNSNLPKIYAIVAGATGANIVLFVADND